jgi:hypothetical protein
MSQEEFLECREEEGLTGLETPEVEGIDSGTRIMLPGRGYVEVPGSSPISFPLPLDEAWLELPEYSWIGMFGGGKRQ